MINEWLYPDYAKFINSLRCPLCNSQLDGNCHPNGSQLYCLTDNEEYRCGWVFGQDEPTYEHIKHIFIQYEYSIRMDRIAPNNYKINIVRYNTDYVPQQRHRSKKEIFTITGNRLEFFRNRLSENEFLNKLKLYLVFS